MTSRFDDAVQALIHGRADELRQLLKEDPGLATARADAPHRATLIHYLGANGVEKDLQRTPPNAVEMLQILVAAGADPDALADIYEPDRPVLPLVISSIHPFLAGVQGDLIRALIAAGAKADGPEGDGQPLKMALCFGYVPAVDALVDSGATIRDIADAAAAGDLQKLGEWIDSEGNVSPDGAIDATGDRHNRFAWPPPAGCDQKELALVYACRFAREDVVDFLVQRGTDINAAPVNGETGLHWAAFAHQNDVLEALLSRGIDRDRQNADGQTAAELARDSGNTMGADRIAAWKLS